MCIRDRYQRRVHGESKNQEKKIQIKIINKGKKKERKRIKIIRIKSPFFDHQHSNQILSISLLVNQDHLNYFSLTFQESIVLLMDYEQFIFQLFPYFRGTIILIIYFWSINLSIYIWNKHKINYLQLLNLKHYHFKQDRFFFQTKLITIITFLLLLFAFYQIKTTDTSASDYNTIYYIALVAVGAILVICFIPTSDHNKIQQSSIFGLLTSNLFDHDQSNAFLQFWFIDQIHCLNATIKEIVLSFCSVFKDGSPREKLQKCQKLFHSQTWNLIFLWPLGIKIYFLLRTLIRKCSIMKKKQVQSVILNILKHVSVIINSIVSYQYHQNNGLFRIWICYSLFNTVFTFLWDVKFDWGLFTSNHGILRKKLIYPSHCFYYISISLNLVLKLSWISSIYFQYFSKYVYKDIYIFILQFLEILRRFILNTIKIEYQWIQENKLVQKDIYKKQDEFVIEITDNNTFQFYV
eukprot:TRINITY_DN3447_c0_g1_i1.p1 TRINITY_DN3447_c0_g1~~TRINITY_DN3447_c0_g1_i1.p1  ORF type:complete len:464 (+),score=35.05 TRINITY_DN3447_c0_g1_i1:191-1582(+)